MSISNDTIVNVITTLITTFISVTFAVLIARWSTNKQIKAMQLATANPETSPEKKTIWRFVKFMLRKSPLAIICLLWFIGYFFVVPFLVDERPVNRFELIIYSLFPLYLIFIMIYFSATWMLYFRSTESELKDFMKDPMAFLTRNK